MAVSARILLVSGSTRSGSTNTAALRTAQAVAPDDDQETLPLVAADLRQQIAAADAVLFCTPEYAGTLPGSFKNLLDWTVGGGEIYGKPVAWINVAAAGRGGGATASLELVLGYVGADIIKPACVQLPVGSGLVGIDGVISDQTVRGQIADDRS